MSPWTAHLWRRIARLALAPGLLAAGLMLSGCDTLVIGKVEPALFPAAVAASAPPLPGRVALEMTPSVRGKMDPGPDMCAVGRARLQLPLGAIVDAALQRQLNAAFAGGALPAALPLSPAGEAEAALSVTEIRLVLSHKLNWLVPIPVPIPPFVAAVAASTNYSARLELGLRVTDALGRLLAQTTVESGDVVIERGMWSSEPQMQFCLRLTHQAAWRAAEQAARVMRETLQAERQRERPL